jgi:hypothetical protein
VIADLDTLLTALYVELTDQIIPALGFARYGPGRPPEVTDAELVCLAMAQVLETTDHWRRQSAARAVHALLLKDRAEERATLTVLPASTPAQGAYRTSGWRKGPQKRNPLPVSPLFDLMLRQLTQGGWSNCQDLWMGAARIQR